MVEQEALKTLADDLGMILEDRDVPQWLQARIAFAGAKKPGTFGRVSGTEDGVRSWVIETLEVDPKANITHRTAIAAVVDAWCAVKRRLDKKYEV